MKRSHVILGGVFLACAAVLAFTDRNPADQVVEAAPRTRAPAATMSAEQSESPGSNPGAEPIVMIAALRARADLIGSGGGDRHDLFGSPFAPPLPSAAPAQAEVPPLPPGPVVPSIPFTYLGKKAADGRWEVYLGRGDETLIVHDQMVIDGTYRVDEINPPTMKLVYLPAKLVQTIDIGSAD
jgi:hypothetical protein